ncbi:AAA family ATPase, partial [Pseudovibrio sp. POLY-S9]|uniref:nucleotide-binding protein n=1 Tax=Pseudovibrio sp. POLY-S9 TaxID=1576596 RepID=UPI00128EC58A
MFSSLFWSILTMSVLEQDTMEQDTLLTQVVSDRDSLAEVIEATALRATDPFSHKVTRTYLPREAAELLGCSPSYVNTLAKELELDISRDSSNRYRSYSLSNLRAIREEAARRVADTPEKRQRYLPHRSADEELAIMAFVNFKGGSAKTTTSVHFAQYAALRGYRVLFLDLDPQGSASTIFGYQPVLIEENQSINAALRYENPLSIRGVIQKTYFEGIDICLGGQWMTEWEQDTPRVMTNAHHYSAAMQERVPELQAELNTPGLIEDRIDEIEQELAQWQHIEDTGYAALHYYQRLRHVLEEVKD